MTDLAAKTPVNAPDTPARPRWPLVLFRASASGYALATVMQPVWAGLFLSGDFAALKAHKLTAAVVGLLGFVTLLCALVLWRVRRTSLAPVLISATLLVLIFVQIVLGFARILALHVPLGVAIVAGVAQLGFYAWRKADR